jgi:hypothetical protein
MLCGQLLVPGTGGLQDYWVLSIGAGGEHSVAMVAPRRDSQVQIV